MALKNSVVIKQTKDELLVSGRQYRLVINLKNGESQFLNGKGKLLFEFPINNWMKDQKEIFQFGFPLKAQVSGNKLTLRDVHPPKSFAKQEYVFEFAMDSFNCRYEAVIAKDKHIKPVRVEYFRGPGIGMSLSCLKEGFSVPSDPISEEEYRNIFPTAGIDQLSAPCVLNIGLKFHYGFVGVGLLDISDATNFGISHPFMGLMTDAPGGNVRYSGGEKYQGPRVVFTFPSDGWNGIEVFRKKLEDEKMVTAVPEKPEWWKRPIYCTYGDQAVQMEPIFYTDINWDAPGFTEEWVKNDILMAEKRLGYKSFTALIDAFWQQRWDLDPVGDPKRFPNMRKLVDWIHSRGHKVLLWYEPHALNPAPAMGKIAREYGVIGKHVINPPEELLHPNKLMLIDYTSPNASAYLQEISRRFFGSDPDCLDADGLKLDGVSLIPPTEQKAKYLKPANGMGLKMVQRYLELFSSAAKAVKPDVLLNYSSSDPRLAHLFDMNRLHDTRVTPLERERRARLSALANPDLLIDSDGAVMMCDWVVHTYVSAAIYSTPSLYYADRFQDGQQLPLKTMKTIGKLFSICEKRYWGRPVFLDYGCWQLHDEKDRVIGESYQGKLCWLKTAADQLQLICFEDPCLPIDLHGMKVKDISPKPDQLRCTKDTLVAKWTPGVIYTITIGS